MAKQNPKSTKAALKKQPLAKMNIIYLFLLIAYGFVTVLTPNLLALDSNGPKFLTFALLNLVTFLYLFSRKEIKTRPEWYFSFFSNGIGIAYTGMIIISLLSFFKATNVLESVLHFAKIFTTFTGAYLVSVLILADKRNILYLSIAMTLLLIFDSFTVFIEINKYIDGVKGIDIGNIKTIYSNKNILASSIFVKIPFALWLLVFKRKWLKAIAIIGIFMAITATFFMSTRAFYLGTFALSIILIVFFIIRYKQSGDKFQLRLGGIYLIILVFSLLIFSATQRYLYPKVKGGYNTNIEERLATISSADASANQRLSAWKRSWHVFKQEPILGVGLGNWKLTTLKEENQTSQDFIYQYKAHNDFIEIPTETGMFGGMFFIAIFLFTAWVFIIAVYKKAATEWLSLIFLPVFGLLCYSFDAFFNFPQDRPEIQALFALYIGLAVAVFSLFYRETSNLPIEESTEKTSFIKRCKSFWKNAANFNQTEKPIKLFIRVPFIIIFGLMLLATAYMLNENFTSLKLQRIVIEDINRGKLSHPASMFLDGFPAVINLNTMAEPIAVQKARYLINENRNDEAIALLKVDKSSPYDTRPEYFIAMAYYNQNNVDSGMVYSEKMYKLKPNFFKNIAKLCDVLQERNRLKEAEIMIDKYLSNTKNNKDAWLYASSFYFKSNNLKKAVSVIDTAVYFFPTDSLILKQRDIIDNKAIITPYQSLYDLASTAYNEKRYAEAIRYYSELLIKIPGYMDALERRAFCYYFSKEYAKSNKDLDFMISKGMIRSNLYNLRGVNYNSIGNKDEACKNFKIAYDMGDKDGLNNYPKLCLPANK
ncbi:MAG: O-antigen ligase family protein [Bacteroidota bacterium]